MYLANDIIQNSKKKGPEYGKEFLKVLRKAFNHIGDVCRMEDRTIGSLGRILKIWEDRGVYDEKAIEEFRMELNREGEKKVTDATASAENTPAAPVAVATGGGAADAPVKVNGTAEKRSRSKSRERRKSHDNNNRKRSRSSRSREEPAAAEVQEHFVLSPKSAIGEYTLWSCVAGRPFHCTNFLHSRFSLHSRRTRSR